ncbi:hypothetical protein DFA_04495 [Cavenderia fasciculata]|uniref:Uncharacterized protein n=1 Tax=Cavenderia fasciculata TaxID=261658 RepID=F4PPR4_CACFS|nr:uncharacterized protein DFA_04495 [Cavenderia fasciculata]EGG22377.1 hypothetical protein DFA_04495 [Cavenderia fasciculata]|eukprot:XP_004360228.1 hypothetical protein DFA_04495 [Cavenderia fasciculata]
MQVEMGNCVYKPFTEYGIVESYEFPPSVLSQRMLKAGDVFILRYPTLTPSSPTHYSILIDICGESTKDNVIGLELHLVLDPDNNQKVVSFIGGRRSRSLLLFSPTFIGKAPSTVTFNQSDTTGVQMNGDNAQSIGAWAGHRFSYFIKQECDGNKVWGPITNCHKYARFLVHELRLQWPEEIKVFKDYQWLDNWYVMAQSPITRLGFPC